MTKIRFDLLTFVFSAKISINEFRFTKIYRLQLKKNIYICINISGVFCS